MLLEANLKTSKMHKKQRATELINNPITTNGVVKEEDRGKGQDLRKKAQGVGAQLAILEVDGGQAGNGRATDSGTRAADLCQEDLIQGRKNHGEIFNNKSGKKFKNLSKKISKRNFSKSQKQISKEKYYVDFKKILVLVLLCSKAMASAPTKSYDIEAPSLPTVAGEAVVAETPLAGEVGEGAMANNNLYTSRIELSSSICKDQKDSFYVISPHDVASFSTIFINDVSGTKTEIVPAEDFQVLAIDCMREKTLHLCFGAILKDDADNVSFHFLDFDSSGPGGIYFAINTDKNGGKPYLEVPKTRFAKNEDHDNFPVQKLFALHKEEGKVLIIQDYVYIDDSDEENTIYYQNTINIFTGEFDLFNGPTNKQAPLSDDESCYVGCLPGVTCTAGQDCSNVEVKDLFIIEYYKGKHFEEWKSFDKQAIPYLNALKPGYNYEVTSGIFTTGDSMKIALADIGGREEIAREEEGKEIYIDFEMRGKNNPKSTFAVAYATQENPDELRFTQILDSKICPQEGCTRKVETSFRFKVRSKPNLIALSTESHYLLNLVNPDYDEMNFFTIDASVDRPVVKNITGKVFGLFKDKSSKVRDGHAFSAAYFNDDKEVVLGAIIQVTIESKKDRILTGDTKEEETVRYQFVQKIIKINFCHPTCDTCSEPDKKDKCLSCRESDNFVAIDPSNGSQECVCKTSNSYFERQARCGTDCYGRYTDVTVDGGTAKCDYCQNAKDKIYSPTLNICMDLDNCLASQFKVEALNECRDDPTGLIPLSPSQTDVIEEEECLNSGKVVLVQFLQEDPDLKCLPISRCGNSSDDADDTYDYTDFRFGLSYFSLICLPLENCDGYTTINGFCSRSCDLGYIDLDNKICHSEASCLATSGKMIHEDSSLCVTETFCKSLKDADLSIADELLPSTVKQSLVLEGNPPRCILIDDCTSNGGTQGVTSNSQDDGICYVSVCPDYLAFSGFTCYNSASDCTDLSDADSTYYTTTELGGQKYCLNKEECKKAPGFLLKKGTGCLTLQECEDGNDFALEQIGVCGACTDYYLTLDGETCLDLASCQAYGDGTEIYYPTQSPTGQKYCLTHQECTNHDTFLIKGEVCILNTECDYLCLFNISEENQVCEPCLNYYLSEDGSQCFRTEEDCVAQSDTVDYFATKADSQGQKYCLKESQCKSTVAFLDFRFLKNDFEEKCILSSECADGALADSNSQDVCNVQCPHPKFLTLDYRCMDDKTACESQEGPAKYSAVTKSSTATTQALFNYCLTKEQCDELEGFIYDADDEACILAEDCSKNTENGECIGTCVGYLKVDKTCHTEADCELFTSPQHYAVTDEEGVKKCLTKAECISNTKVLFHEDDVDCITPEDCDTFTTDDGKCKDTCTNFRDVTEKFCYSETHCNDNLDAADNYSAVGELTDAKKYCLSEEECKESADHLYHSTDDCIKKGDCDGTGEFEIKEEGTCGACTTFLLTADGTGCVTSDYCLDSTSMGGTYFSVTDTSSQAHCINEQECKDKSGFLFKTDDSDCIKTTECATPYVNIDDETCEICSDYYQANSQKKCRTEADCTNDTTMGGVYYATEADSNDQKYCLTEAQCKSSTSPYDEFVLYVEGTDKECILQTECTGITKEIDATDDQTCNKVCTGLQLDDGECIETNQCGAGDYVTYTKTEADTSAQAYCYTEAECKASGTYLWNASPSSDTELLCKLKTGCTGYEVNGEQSCSTSCDHFLDSGDDCYTETACNDRTGYSAVTDLTGEKICISEAECKADQEERFLFDVGTSKCIKKAECLGGKFRFLDKTCQATCPHFTHDILEICYTREECLDLDKALYISDDLSTKKCLTEVECKDLTNSTSDQHLVTVGGTKMCVKEERCLSDLKFIFEDYCYEECPEGNIYYDGQICYEECPNGKIKQLGINKCIEKTQCEYEREVNGEVQKIVGEYNDVLRKCIFEFEIGGEESKLLEATEVKVPENQQGETLYDVQVTDFGRTQVNLNYNPREIRKETALGDIRTRVIDPYFLPLPALRGLKVESWNDAVRRVIRGSAISTGRILLEGNIDVINGDSYEVVSSGLDDGEVYIAVQEVTEDPHFIEVELNTDDEFTLEIDGKEFPMKFKMDTVTYEVPMGEEQYTFKTFSRFIAMVYQGYMTAVAPIIPLVTNSALSVQGFLSQNYQRLYLISQMDYGIRDRNDYLYVETFRDWVGELGVFMVSEEVEYEELDQHCSREWERFCTFEMNRFLIPKGLIGIVLILVFGIISLIATKNKNSQQTLSLQKNCKSKKIINQIGSNKSGSSKSITEQGNKNDSQEAKFSLGSFLGYKVFPSYLLGLQTTMVYYIISSIFQMSYEGMVSQISVGLSCLVVLGLVIFIVITLTMKSLKIKEYGEDILRKGFSKVFNTRKSLTKIKLFLLAGLVYDIGISVVISAFPQKRLVQAITFLVLELGYLVLTFAANPFKRKLIGLLFIVRRLTFFLQGALILVASLLNRDSTSTISILELTIFVFSCLHALLSIVIIVLSLGPGQEKEDTEMDKEESEGSQVRKAQAVWDKPPGYEVQGDEGARDGIKKSPLWDDEGINAEENGKNGEQGRWDSDGFSIQQEDKLQKNQRSARDKDSESVELEVELSKMSGMKNSISRLSRPAGMSMANRSSLNASRQNGGGVSNKSSLGGYNAIRIEEEE